MRSVMLALATICAAVAATGARAATFPPGQVLLDGAFQGQYGRSVAIDGDRMAIGAPLERLSPTIVTGGAVHAYVRAGRFWVREARIVATGAGNGTQLGLHVAIAGDRIVASAGADAAGGAGVYVFNRVGGTWVQEAKLVPPATTGAFVVAVSGDTLAAGAPNASGGGVVHVYARGAAWTLQQSLSNMLGTQADCGSDVALRGNRILVGCPFAQRPGLTSAGAALVYLRTGSTWAPEATLIAPDATPHQRYATSVALTDTEALVGAPATDTFQTLVAQPGAAYLHVRSGTSWSAGTKWLPSDSVPGDFFGYSVALAGDAATIGAPHLHLSGELPDRGAAYVFLRNGAAWSEGGRLVNDDGAAGDYFAASVATAPDAFLAGAYVSEAGGVLAGAAFHFTRQALAVTGVSAAQGNPDDLRGTSVATAGNFLIVGGPNVEVGANADQGVVTIYEKIGGAYAVRQTLTASDGRIGDKFGTAVGTNDTGTVIAIGVPGYDFGPQTDAGTAYVFERVANAWMEVARFDDVGNSFRQRAGTAIAVSGDGTAVFVGAPGYDQGVGRVLRFARTGAPPGAKGTSAWNVMQLIGRPSGPVDGDKWGASLALEGTMLAVGAPGAANAGGDANHGLVQVLKPSGALYVPHTVEIRDDKLAGADQTRFGTSVALDGGDLAVGAPDTDVAMPGAMNLDQGLVETYAVNATTGGVAAQDTVLALNGAIGNKFGAALAADGGLLVVGAPLATAGTVPVDGQGIAYVFRAERPPGGLVQWLEDQQLTVPPSNPGAGDAFGSAIAIRAGQLAIGAPRFDFPEAAGPKGAALVRDVGNAFGMAYVSNTVFANGFE